MRSVRTEETLLGGYREWQSAGLFGVRVFRPSASYSETLDWSRKERARVVIGCRSACGFERCVAGGGRDFGGSREVVSFGREQSYGLSLGARVFGVVRLEKLGVSQVQCHRFVGILNSAPGDVCGITPFRVT